MSDNTNREAVPIYVCIREGFKKTKIEISKYAENEFCMIWVTFDANVMALSNQTFDVKMSKIRQGEGEGGNHIF